MRAHGLVHQNLQGASGADLGFSLTTLGYCPADFRRDGGGRGRLGNGSQSLGRRRGSRFRLGGLFFCHRCLLRFRGRSGLFRQRAFRLRFGFGLRLEHRLRFGLGLGLGLGLRFGLWLGFDLWLGLWFGLGLGFGLCLGLLVRMRIAGRERRGFRRLRQPRIDPWGSFRLRFFRGLNGGRQV